MDHPFGSSLTFRPSLWHLVVTHFHILQSRGCVYWILDFIQNLAIRIPFGSRSLVGLMECPHVIHLAVPRHSIAILDQLLSDIRSHAHTLVAYPNQKGPNDHEKKRCLHSRESVGNKTWCLIDGLVCHRVMSCFRLTNGISLSTPTLTIVDLTILQVPHRLWRCGCLG